MKNSLILLLMFSSVSFSYSQVGINTNAPAATLDVLGNPDATNIVDGIIAPRITGEKLRLKTNYNLAQKGTIIYVTVADPSPAGQTINVIKEGYYYFDGYLWQSMASPTSNIATEPWLETSTTNQATNTSVNLYKNGDIGLGDFSSDQPAGNLHIRRPNGFAYFENNGDNINGFNLNLRKSRGSFNDKKTVALNDYLGGVNFGGYTTDFYFRAGINGLVDSSPSGFNIPTALIFKTGSTTLAERMRISSSGNVGIGSNDPAYKLDIATGGTSSTPVKGFKLADGNQGIHKVLTSDIDGVGTWEFLEDRIIRGTFLNPVGNASLDNKTAGLTGPVDLGAYIDLPPGVWEVELNLLINPGNTNSNSYTFLRFFFSDSGSKPNVTGDLMSETSDGTKIATTISGTSITFDYNGPSTDSYYSIINGKVVIKNSLTVNKRYFLSIGDAQYRGAQRTFYNLGLKSYVENMMTARRIINP